MKLRDLYNRVVETTGLDVMTIGSLQAAVSNCMADLTSRGYRQFKELHITSEDITIEEQDFAFIKATIPYSEIRKILYCKVYFNNTAVNAKRYSLSNPRIQRNYYEGRFRSVVPQNEAIFYIKEDKLYIEFHPFLGDFQDFSFGYYARLNAPVINTSISEDENLDNIEIDIRKEFEDALVFYAAYFYYSRYVKDTEKIVLYQNQYKYYIEDITHELAYEDEFFEEDSIIHTED